MDLGFKLKPVLLKFLKTERNSNRRAVQQAQFYATVELKKAKSGI
jgi:hypothetical protein